MNHSFHKIPTFPGRPGPLLVIIMVAPTNLFVGVIKCFITQYTTKSLLTRKIYHVFIAQTF